jgi:hypothetical protein
VNKSNARVYKTKAPLSAWLGALAIGGVVLVFILSGVWQMSSGITEAKMTGTVVAKEFKPMSEPEQQITLHKAGEVRVDQVAGEYIITVEVPQKDRSKKSYTVWLNDKLRYDAVKVGDNFDVGPYLVR